MGKRHQSGGAGDGGVDLTPEVPPDFNMGGVSVVGNRGGSPFPEYRIGRRKEIVASNNCPGLDASVRPGRVAGSHRDVTTNVTA